MKPTALYDSILALATMRQPFFIWGDPGVGKSQIVAQAADALFGGKGKDKVNYFRDLRAVLLDPVDLMGIPVVEKGRTCWAAPRMLPSKGVGLLFFDELNRAPIMVQNACLQLVLGRRLGEYTLPEGWVVGAAGNFENETGVQRMPDALRSRFTHLRAEADVDDWCAYANRENYDAAVVAFVRFRPELLHKYDRAQARKENAFPCPRTWEFASRIVQQQTSKVVEQGLLAGTVGEAAALEFAAFLSLYRELPDMDAMLASPDTAPIPTKPALCYVVANALARMATLANVSAVMTYLERIPQQEYAVMAVKDMSQRDAKLSRCGTLTKWKIANADVII